MNLNYKKIGSQGADLIILHGLFGMLDNWMTLGNRFGQQNTVWLVDQRNHGKSPHTPEISYPLMAKDLAEFMDQQGIGRAHLLGHSMGGKTVMEFAFRYPEKILKLIVADIAPKAYPPHHDDVIEALESVDLSGLARRSEAEDQMARLIPDVGTRQFLLKNLHREDDAYRWKMNLPALIANYELITGNVDPNGIYTGETLFIKGEKSSYIKPDDWPMIQKHFPNSRLVVIQGAGHWVHAEAQEEFADIVEGFLVKA